MGKLKEKLSCLVPPSFGIGQEEIHPLVLCVQDDNPSLKTMLSLLDTILSEIASPDQGIASLALRSLAYVLHIEKSAAEISGEIAATILSSLCQLIIATDKKATCSLAIWCLSVQKLPPQLVEMHLPRILEALMHAIEHPKSPKSLIHEALQAVAKIAQSFSSFRTRSSLWAPAVYRHLLSADKKDREIAEQCMKDLKSTLLPPQLSLSKVVAVDINETLLPKMERMVKSKALVLPTVRAWGWFVRLLGGLAGENRTLVNQLLKIVEVTFTSQDTSVRMASLVAWEALIDALLQSSTISVPENGSIQTGVNLSSLSSGEHEKSHLAPPLKRLKLLMVPLISITINDKDQTVRLACWRTWSYLAQKLGIGINQASVVNIVVTPIFEAIFKNGPDKGHPSAWDSCLNSLEGWICCKVQNRIDSCLSQTLCMDIVGKVPSPKTPTCQAPESLAETSSSILWAPWSLDLLDVLLKLVKVLWNMGVKSLKTSCISYLSLNGALRMFRLLVKGVESDGKGAVKPLKQHIDSVHLLLMFLSNLSSECVSPACSKDLLSAMWSLIESLMDLQPLVLSSSFYKLAFASVSVQEKLGQCCSTSREVDNGRDQQEVLEFRSCESVTPIVYIIAAWLRLGVSVDFAGPDGFFFKNKVASLVISATSGINILGNLQGIAIVLDCFLFEVSKQNTVSEDDLLAGHNINKEARFSDSILQNCMCLLHSWSVFAEHTRSYLERANNVPAVEGGMGDSGYQVIFSFLLFPLQICMHLASLSHINNNANFEASSQEFASDVRGGAFQLVCNTWVKLYDCASYISSRTSSQPNFFASGLSQKILKLLEKQWQQDGNNKKEAANGSSFLAEMLTAVVANVLKQTEVSSLAMLAINRKKRLGSFMGMSGMTNCARGSEADASTVRDILLLTARILDLSCDKFTAGQAYWLDSTARVLEEVARFTARLDSQRDVLVFLQDFSKPYAKWLKSTESFFCSQANVSSSSTALLQALQKAWQKHLHSLQKCHPPLAFDSNLLSLQAFALVPALQHSQTSISNCTVSFWEATYGSKAAALQYPPCMLPVLSQLKSKPGSNRGCAQSSRRKSDVSSYTYTGRRRLQMFQEHLVDTKKVPHCLAMFGPRMATCDEDITSQAVCPSLTGRTGNEESNAINTPANVIPETSRRPTGFATSAFTSMETMQSGLDTSQAHDSPSLDMLSKNGGIMQGANKESAATSTGNSTVAHPCLRTHLPANFVDKTFQGNLTSSPPKCVLAPKRKNLRFSDLKTFAYASTSVPDEGRFPMTEEQSAFSPVKQGEARKTRDDSDNQSPNSSPSIIEATQTKMSFKMLNQSIGKKMDGVADCGTSPRKSKGSRFLRYSGEIKKLGIRQQRFLRSTGSLRGGKFWRDAAGAVKVLQKIKKQATEATKNSPEAEMFPKVRKRGRPPHLKLMADETSAEEVKNYAVDEACDEKMHRKRGRPRRMGLINSHGALEAAEAAANAEDMGQQVKTSCEQGANAQDMGQQVQTSCEQGPNIGPSKFEKLLKKASMESPFRVQTLNRGIYGKIFSSIANHATAINNIASRSHHRKNDFPRRIPLSKDEQQEDTDLQESRGAHLHQKVFLGKRSKEAERYRGFEFATPSKILRSGKRLKSRKWEAVLAADKCGNQGAHLDSTLPVTSFLKNYESLSHSLGTASHLVNVGVAVENECSLFSLGGSGNPRSVDVLQAGNQPNHHGCQLGEHPVFKQPPMMAFDEDSACPAGKTVSHGNHLSMATFVSLENKGSLAATTLCNELGFDRESIDLTKKRRLCDVLADVSTSSEWNTMSLNDLDCAQKILSVLQDLVCESKKRARNKHAGNL